MAPHAWVLAILLALPTDARALEMPASYRYRIHHQVFGDIGEHRMTVARAGDAIVVEHTAELAVEILGITAFHRRTRFRELWRDERLVEFDGLVEDNGEPFAVAAHADGDRLVVQGPAGRIAAPADTAPSEPSLEFAITREWFFDSRTGALLNTAVTRAGRDPLKVGDRVVKATRYEIAGDLDQQVWFDDSGAWVQWRLWRQGAAITLVRD
jgi:Family of unknown function (DUF6134)